MIQSASLTFSRVISGSLPAFNNNSIASLFVVGSPRPLRRLALWESAAFFWRKAIQARAILCCTFSSIGVPPPRHIEAVRQATDLGCQTQATLATAVDRYYSRQRRNAGNHALDDQLCVEDPPSEIYHTCIHKPN